ncbi:hypothetical protein Esti_005527 [Eimeria stiedai]
MLKNDVSRIGDALRLPTQTGRGSSAARHGTAAAKKRVASIRSDLPKVHTPLTQQPHSAQEVSADAPPAPLGRVQCAEQEMWKPQITTRSKLQTTLLGPAYSSDRHKQCVSHLSITARMIWFGCRYRTFPEVCRGNGKAYYDSVVLGRHGSATTSQQSGASRKTAPVWSKCQNTPQPLFDSRAAAAAAACCCLHAATADTASPSMWTGSRDFESSCTEASSATSIQVSTEVLKTSEVAETPHVDCKQVPICNRQAATGTSDICEMSKPSVQPAKWFQKGAAFGCTISTVLQERPSTPAGFAGCGMEQPATSCDGSVPLDTEDQVIAWIKSSNCRGPWQNHVFNIPLPPPPRLEPDTNRFLAEQKTLQQHTHTGVSARRGPRQTPEPCWHPKRGLDASTQPIDDNQEHFEMMLESQVKVLVAKAIEQSIEEMKQEQQLHYLLQLKQELLKQQEKGLRELEEGEALKQVKAQQVEQDQLAVKERESQLWRRMWVVHIASILFKQNTMETVVEQLDQEKFFYPATDEAASAALTEFAKSASNKLEARVAIGDTLVKEWSFAEAMKKACLRQQNLLLWYKHKNRRENLRRKRDIRRGVVHIFVTARELESAAIWGSHNRKSMKLKREFTSELRSEAHPTPQNGEAFKKSNDSEDSAELLQKAQAAITAAVDVFCLSLPKSAAQEDLRSREGVLQAETQRITEAFEEEQQQLARLQERAGFGIKKWTLKDEMPKQQEFSTSAVTSAAICLGSFKILRPGQTTPSSKELISMEQLLLEVQQQLCKCFSAFADAIRNMQIAIELKGKKISKMEALLDHEFGELRTRFERKIKFADQTDSSGVEADADLRNEFDA